jgi:hypothetical protein
MAKCGFCGAPIIVDINRLCPVLSRFPPVATGGVCRPLNQGERMVNRYAALGRKARR